MIFAGKKDKQKTTTTKPPGATKPTRPTQHPGASRQEQVKVTLTHVLERPEFTTGLRYGLITVAVGLVLAAVWKGVRHRAAPIAGLVFAVGALLAMHEAVTVPDGLVVGIAVLAGATFAAELARLPPVVEVLASIPGAVMVAHAVPAPATDWVRPLVVVVTVVGGAAVGGFDHRWRRRGVGPVLAALTIAGIFACVPETKTVLVLLGVALPLPLMGWPVALGSLGRAGSYAFTGVAMWAAAVDGAARPSAIIGAAACLGLLVVEPLVRAIAARRSPLELVPERLPAIVWVAPVALIHLGLVFVASRVIGLRHTVDESLPLLAGTVLVVVAVGIALRLWRPPALPRRRA